MAQRPEDLPPDEMQVRRCKTLLGTSVDVTLTGPHSRADLLDWSKVAFDRMQDIHRAMSFHEPASELSRLNQSRVNEWVPVSADMRAVLSFALELSAASEGRFNVTIAPCMMDLDLLPPVAMPVTLSLNWQAIELGPEGVRFSENVLIDLGGVAKGYAVDMAIEALRNTVPETVRFCVNAGGDLRFSDPEGERVYIRDVGKHGGMNILKPQRAAVATTTAQPAETARGAIIDPMTTRSIDMEALSVSVFADTCMHADGLTKIVTISQNVQPVLKRYNAIALVQTGGRQKWIE